jgi:CheY-like chemotaxis protein
MKRIYTPTKRKRILIVDDDVMVASIYRKKFEDEQFAVDVASNGERALQLLEESPVDLVILDSSLPGMNGVALLQAIRSRPGSAALPVIVFSNAYFPGLTQAVSAAGASRCVKKSDCTPRQMVNLVRAAIDPSVGPGPAPARKQPDRIDETELNDLEKAFQASLVADFRDNTPQKLLRLRNGYHTFVNAKVENLRLAELCEMHQQARFLAGAAGIAGFHKIAELTSALEGLLDQLSKKPAKITPSVIRTIAQAVDSVAALFEGSTNHENEKTIAPVVLVVDDEAISRETVCSALEKADLAVTGLEDPTAAEHVLEETHFDLIFLDVEMPGQSGMELCAKIRKMTMNRTTPVVFVTAHSDFGNRAKSSLSGGNDFIAKPFLPIELTVKALTWLFMERLTPVPTLKIVPAEQNVTQPQALKALAG